MPNIGELIGRSFERILRWAYPGILFTALLALARPSYFAWWKGLPGDRAFVAALIIVVASVVVYGLQRYILDEALNVLLDCLGLGTFSTGESAFRKVVRWLHLPPWVGRMVHGPRSYCHGLAAFVIRRFGRRGLGAEPDVEGMSDYVVYGRAVAHVMSVTGWLPLALDLLADPGSESWKAWWPVLKIVSVLSLGGYVIQTLVLNRVVRDFWLSRPTES